MKNSLAQALLFLLVLLMGFELGAGLYEARVLVPLWAPDPQAAYKFAVDHPAFATHAGPQWWIFLTPLTAVVALGCAIFAGWLSPAQIGLARIGAIVVAGMAVVTFAWFVPNIIELQGEGVLLLTAEHAKSRGTLWASLNWVRGGVMLAAQILLMIALSRGARRQPA